MSDTTDDEPFFAPPEDEEPHPPQPRYRSKPSEGAPPATIPSTVPVERVLARTDDVAVTITGLQVYPASLEFEVVVFARPKEHESVDDGFDPMLFHLHHHPGRSQWDAALRLGVEFDDGRKATNVTGDHWPDDRGTGRPILRSRGGGGGGDRYAQSYWLWPLPAAGSLTFVCEWPSQGIPVSRLEVDGDEIRAAAGRAQVIFPDDHLPERPARGDGDGGGWLDYVPCGR
jgi:hypothetical protein